MAKGLRIFSQWAERMLEVVCLFFFLKAFSFDNEVYRSYLVLVEIPA